MDVKRGAAEGARGEDAGAKRARTVPEEPAADEDWLRDGVDPATAAAPPQQPVRVVDVDVVALHKAIGSCRPEGSGGIPVGVVRAKPMIATASPFGVGVHHVDGAGAKDLHDTMTAPMSGLDLWATDGTTRSSFSWFRLPATVEGGIKEGESLTMWLESKGLLEKLAVYKQIGTCDLVFDPVKGRVTAEFSSGDNDVRLSFKQTEEGVDMDYRETFNMFAPDISVRMTGSSLSRKLNAMASDSAKCRIELHRLLCGTAQHIGLYFAAEGSESWDLSDGFHHRIDAAEPVTAFDFRGCADTATGDGGKSGKDKDKDKAAAAPFDPEARMAAVAAETKAKASRSRTKMSYERFKEYADGYKVAVAQGLESGTAQKIAGTVLSETYTLLMDRPFLPKKLMTKFKLLNADLEADGLTLLVAPTDECVPLVIVTPTATSLAIHAAMPLNETEA